MYKIYRTLNKFIHHYIFQVQNYFRNETTNTKISTLCFHSKFMKFNINIIDFISMANDVKN